MMHATPLDHGPNLIQSNDAAAVLTQVDPENRDLHWHGPSLCCRRQPTLSEERGGPSHKLPRGCGPARARQRDRSGRDRDLVCRRGPCRTKEQDHSALGQARFATLGPARSTHCLDLYLWRHLSRCRPNAPNSTRSRMSGSSSATTGSPTASSAPTPTSSNTAALPGTTSSTNRGQSCQSDCAIGHSGSDQWDLVLANTHHVIRWEPASQSKARGPASSAETSDLRLDYSGLWHTGRSDGDAAPQHQTISDTK